LRNALAEVGVSFSGFSCRPFDFFQERKATVMSQRLATAFDLVDFFLSIGKFEE
jgi:hypothetical protein